MMIPKRCKIYYALDLTHHTTTTTDYDGMALQKLGPMVCHGKNGRPVALLLESFCEHKLVLYKNKSL